MENWDWLADDIERDRRYDALSGIQKSWVLGYLEGAAEHPETFFESVLFAIEIKSLRQDFDEGDFLGWADDNRHVMTTEGRAAWTRLNTAKQANTGDTSTQRQADTAGDDAAPGKKPGPSADVQKLRDKLYDARQVHILKAGTFTAEAWATWIPKFIKGLRPKSLLNAKIYYENRGTFMAKELDAKQWEALYKREHARRHKNAG